jgi:murein DD-endopeptidase MepM/ murein hydrolase activator NlpD
VDEQKINELIHEIQNLVKALGTGGQSLNKSQASTGSGVSADASTKRLITALGMLASKIENTTSKVKKSAEEQAKSAADFSKSVDALSDSMDAAAKATQDKAAKEKAAADELAETAHRARLSQEEILREQKAAAKKARETSNTEILEKAKSSGKISKGQAIFGQILSKAGIPLGRSSKDLAANASTLSAGLNLASAGFGGLTKSMQILGKGFRSNTLDAGGVAEGVGSFITSITGATKYMGKFGIVLSPVINAMVEYAIAAAKQGSEQANVFNSLAKSGANTTSGLNGIMHSLHDFNLVTKDAAKVTGLISSSAPNLAIFSKGVSSGVEAMAGLSKEIGASGLRKEFKLLGYDTDAQREAQFRYMRVVGAAGALQLGDSKKLAAGAAEYLRQQDRITRATGVSADAQEAAVRAAHDVEQFQFRILKLSQGTQEEKEQAVREQENYKAISAALGQKAADAYAASTTGFITEANKGFATMGIDVLELGRDQTSSPIEMVSKMREMMIGPGGPFSREGMATTMGQFGRAREMGFGDKETVAKLIGTDPAARLAAADQEQRKLIDKPDPGVKAAVETSENTLKNAKNMEAAVQLGVDGMQKFGSALTGLAAKITNLLPGKTAKGDSTGEKALDYAGKIVDEALNPFGGLIKMLRGQGFADGGIARGPGSGHLQLLHGTEAVIPLKGGGVPVQLSGGIEGGGIDAGPVFNPQTETNFLLEKNTEELVKANVTLSQMLEAITGGATITGAGGGGAAAMAQEALAAHDHEHPHGEKGEVASPELAAQIAKGFVNPLEKMVQTSGFVRNDGKTGHGAIDLAGKIGDKIMAPISGVARVLSEKESGGYGNMVEVTDSVTGVKHMLAHMDKTMVKTGDVIKAGQQIGTVGNTGKSTGAHLHHEIRDKSGKKIDPSQFYTGVTDPQGRPISRPGFGSTAGGAATGNPNIARQGQRAGATQYPGPASGMGDGLGKMSEKYETGGRGSGTVGWDKVGGTSYGKYQIASKVGAMKDFLKFAEQSGRGDVAKKLRDAGAESDTGGTSGKSVDVWKQMAAGGELGDLEHQFIKKRSFDPAMAGVKDPKLKKMIESNKGLQEMMWSTAVQHGGGGAAGIMNKTYKEGMSQEDLVKAVYAERGTRFGGSTEEVQKSVKNRFKSEQGDVMAMLGMPATPGAPGAGMLAGAQPGMPARTRGAPGMPAAAPGAGGGLMGVLGGMLGLGGAPGAQSGAGTGASSPLENITQSVMGMFGLGGGTSVAGPGQADMAGVTAGGAPGAIGGDISAITQAMEAQTAATQTAITSGMENLTTQLVDKLGAGAGGTADPAVPTLLGEILSAQREQTTAINRLIQVNTS